MKQLVLASASPRRKQLLEELGFDFMVHPSDFEEKDTHLTPEELVTHNALGKAQDVARHYRNALIIGVDTVGAFQDHILNKPKDRKDAKRILRLISNTTHKVISGICVMDSDKKRAITAVETTFITIDRMEESEIDAYIRSGEGEDKAAGYAIQGLGSLFVKKIEGDYFNVVGLPIYRLRKLLKKMGVKNVLDYRD
ncbi:MAG: septum formation protein Maf [Nitrospirae bacterium]|nr:septum formation protein Maf [Nitrospirota bacterium]